MDPDPYTSTEPVSLGLAEALLGPILVGATLQIGLYGFIISHLINLHSSPTWTRASRITRAVCYGVVFLNTAYTGLNVYTIWYWGTLPARDYGTIAAGNIPSSAGPVIMTTIASIVQITLACRSSKIMKRALYRYIYIAVIGCTGLVAYFGTIVLTVTTIRWHYDGTVDWGPTLTLKKGLMCWMWAECAIDVTITLVYLVQLRHTLWGQNATSDSVFLLIGRLVVRWAMYTAIFAALVAIMAQLFCDSLEYFGLDFVFALPLGSLYTVSLFTTLTIPEVVERRLGGHAARVSQTSAIYTASGAGNTPRAPGVARLSGFYEDREPVQDSE